MNMNKVFDYDNKRLYLETVAKPIFDLSLRGRIVIIGGDSGKGKTMLCNRIIEMQALSKTSSAVPYVANIKVFTESAALDLDSIKSLSKYLIIIDEADVLLANASEIVDFINHDYENNQYLVFSRGLIPLKVTPNYCADFEENDQIITLKYAADIKGWF